VSASNLTARAERKILKAFAAIHSLGVIHGDIRADNILVSESGDAVWIIDFEFAEIIKQGDDVKMAEIFQETQAVEDMLKELKDHRRHSCHELQHNNGVNIVATQGEAY
jgi:serine/threonine protein kinase